MVATREELLAETFLLLADTLVDDFDPIEVLTVVAERCVVLLGATATGIMIVDPRGTLHVVAESSDEARVLELFQIQHDEGPCLDAFHNGQPVIHGDLTTSPWARFGPLAIDAGLRAVHAFPMRLRADVVGTLNLFMNTTGDLAAVDVAAAQALAHAATITVLQDQAAHRSHQLTSQLQGALNSRVTIEQAKGALAERANITPEEAFTRLRGYARSNNTKLTEVAAALVARTHTDTAMAELTFGTLTSQPSTDH
ncbi:MAG: GAF and ANTAR domain-containing protein [Acidimicrobiales bacterium]